MELIPKSAENSLQLLSLPQREWLQLDWTEKHSDVPLSWLNSQILPNCWTSLIYSQGHPLTKIMSLAKCVLNSFFPYIFSPYCCLLSHFHHGYSAQDLTSSYQNESLGR